MVAKKKKVKRYWLRKSGTNLVFQRTPTLAARDDMIAVSEEKAMELRDIETARRRREILAAENDMAGDSKKKTEVVVDEEKQRQIEEGLIPAKEGEEESKGKKNLDEMNEDEMRATLADLKITVGEEEPPEALREMLRAVLTADSKTVADDEAPVSFAPEEPAAPAETPEEPAVDYTELNRNDLAPYCKKAGIPFSGSKVDIVAALQAAKGTEEAPVEEPAAE